MFLCSLIKELCTKEENGKTGCNFNFGHECTYIYGKYITQIFILISNCSCIVYIPFSFKYGCLHLKRISHLLCQSLCIETGNLINSVKYCSAEKIWDNKCHKIARIKDHMKNCFSTPELYVHNCQEQIVGLECFISSFILFGYCVLWLIFFFVR